MCGERIVLRVPPPKVLCQSARLPLLSAAYLTAKLHDQWIIHPSSRQRHGYDWVVWHAVFECRQSHSKCRLNECEHLSIQYQHEFYVATGAAVAGILQKGTLAMSMQPGLSTTMASPMPVDSPAIPLAVQG